MYALLSFFSLLLLLTSTLPVFAERDPYQVSVFEGLPRPDAPEAQNALRQCKAWQAFEHRNGRWHVSFDALTQLPIRAAGKGIPMHNGLTTEERARHFLQTELSGFALPAPADLVFNHINQNEKTAQVRFKQYYQGLELLFAHITVRLSTDNKVVAFSSDLHPNIELSTISPLLNATQAANMAMNNMQGNFDAVGNASLKILPIPTQNGYTYKLVYELSIKGTSNNNKKGDYYTLVDANNGQVYYRHNRVKYCNFGAVPHTHQTETETETESEVTTHLLPNVKQAMGNTTIKANVIFNPLQTAQLTPMQDMQLQINGSTYYTNQNGDMTYAPPLPIPGNGSAFLAGKWAEVYKTENGTEIPSYNITVQAAGGELTLNTPTSDVSAVAGYHHVTTQHNHMKQWLPQDFSMMDFPMMTYVDRTDGNCNAFYDGNVNFFAAGGGCPATARFDDIVYHEYGHGINYFFYNYLGGDWNNGALGEGYADIWALHITGNPIMAQGFLGGANSSIRRYDIDPKVYPDDLVGEVHADGEIICGAWWDLGQAIGLDEMFAIFIGSHYGTPMRPDGQEGALYSDILFEALLADDDNNNLADGTPNSIAIIEAFDLHGIKLQIAATITHQELPLAAANTPNNLPIQVQIDFNYSPFIENIGLQYRNDDDTPYQFVEAQNAGGFNYTASIPAQAPGTIVDYYIEIQNNLNAIPTVAPTLANDANPNIPYQLLIGYQAAQTIDFSSNTSTWNTASPDDDASTGFWTIGTPNESILDNGNIVQTNSDHSPSNDNRCAFTGNAAAGGTAGTNDVDDGQTTLTSPPFDLTIYQNPAISFHRWFTNDQGANPRNDNWEVYISDDGNEWVEIENLNVPDHSWRMRAFKVRDYVSLSQNVYLKFIASDRLVPSEPQFEGGSLVEAAIDDLVIYDLSTPIGIDAAVAPPFAIYPNPVTSEYLHIAPNNNAHSPITALKLLYPNGQQTWQTTVSNNNNNEYRIPVGNLPAGIYVLQIETKEQVYQQKISVH